MNPLSAVEIGGQVVAVIQRLPGRDDLPAAPGMAGTLDWGTDWREVMADA